MKTGILYGVGVGPGDPELMTLKAVRVMREADIIAVPDTGDGRQTALDIARQWVEGKALLHCHTPMTRDKAALAQGYDRIADELCGYLRQGKTIAFLTLGDPTVYSTYLYIDSRVRARGFDTRLIAGVPSFCAAAAALHLPLCEGSEPLHILPASHGELDEGLSLAGGKVLMKAGRQLPALEQALAARGQLENSALAVCCGMENERLYPQGAPWPQDAGYFAVAIVKEGKA